MKKEHKAILQGNIKKYRLLGKRDGIKYCSSSAAFANHINLNPKTYKNYETGAAVPDYDNLIKIATALGLPSIDKLFNYEPPSDDNCIRFFLEDLGIPFKTKASGHKEYILELPAKIKNDVQTWERINFDVNAAEVKIYESSVLRWKQNWFGEKKIVFREGDFESIVTIYHEHKDQLESFSSYPFVRQLLFLGLAKAFSDQEIGEPDEEVAGEYNSIVSFLLDLEKFVDEIRKAREQENWYSVHKENGTWEESDYLKLQDEMNYRLNTEQLREVFLDMLNNIFKENGRGGIKVIRQRINSKK